MGKFCRNCGAPMEDKDMFCTSCGTRVEEMPKQEETPKREETPVYQMTPQQSGNSGYQENTGNEACGNKAGITERSIALAIVLSIITCGIYGLYWMYKLNEEMNQLAGDMTATSGGTVILLSIVTCGIYAWYWFYKMGEKVDNMKNSDSNKILFIVLGIFGLGIINYAIMQDTINKEIAK